VKGGGGDAVRHRRRRHARDRGAGFARTGRRGRDNSDRDPLYSLERRVRSTPFCLVWRI